MPDERTYNVISGDKCLFESMTKEQILAAIVQAVETHQITDVDTGFVQTIKEQNHGTGLKFWIGSTAEYNALQSIEQDVFYILTDDTELEDMEADLASFRETLDGINDIISGLSNTVETNSSDLADLKARKSLVLFDADDYGQTIPYNEGFLVPIPLNSSTIDITDLSLVIVSVYSGDIICTVSKNNNAGLENNLYIKGCTPVQAQYHDPEQGSLFGTATTVVDYIHLTIDTVNNWIAANNSVICTTNGTSGDIAFKLEVYKITGVM